MTTAQELATNIGKRAMLGLPNSPLRFEVEITDARKRYGNLDYRVRPIAGDGWTWHASHLLTILDTEQAVATYLQRANWSGHWVVSTITDGAVAVCLEAVKTGGTN